MKSSKYNYCIEKTGSFLFFNGISHSYFEVNNFQKEAIEQLLLEPYKYKNLIPTLFNKLYTACFIVDDSTDEIEIIREKNHQSINKKDYMLIIMPTLDCNFSCWYCFQNHYSSKMSPDIIKRVKKHINNMVLVERIESLQIEWFGGEPFMNFHIVKEITSYAKQLCDKENVQFFSSATTNAFFINHVMAKDMQLLNFKQFQITLDGDRERHNKVKVSKNVSSFDATLNNINTLIKYIPDVTILLRINYDEKNLNPNKITEQINQILLSENRNKVKIFFRRIWQINTFAGANVLIKKCEGLLKLNGYTCSPSEIQINYLPCYESRKYYNTINFDGSILKCTADKDSIDKPKGFLQPDGSISWNKDFDLESHLMPLYENDFCLKCKHLPICMGPCSKNIDVIDKSSLNTICTKAQDLTVNERIISYCENFK